MHGVLTEWLEFQYSPDISLAHTTLSSSSFQAFCKLIKVVSFPFLYSLIGLSNSRMLLALFQLSLQVFMPCKDRSLEPLSNDSPLLT